MKVLLLSPYPERIAPTIEAGGDTAIPFNEAPYFHQVIFDGNHTTGLGTTNKIIDVPNSHWPRADWIVSYGYRHIIREPLLSRYKGRIINLHLSYLPWNRGADPNFWSWFDGSYKGVTIHHIDAGLDTGPIIARRILSPPNTMTLRETYALLREQLEDLFAQQWPVIRAEAGTFHRARDKDPWLALLPKGWDTPCSEVETMGRMSRLSRDGQVAT